MSIDRFRAYIFEYRDNKTNVGRKSLIRKLYKNFTGKFYFERNNMIPIQPVIKEISKMKKLFPKIGQLKDAAYEVNRRSSFLGLDDNQEPIYDSRAKKPTLAFRGTVKLHGTNGGILFKDGFMDYQSRTRVIPANHDNEGFVASMSTLPWQECMKPLTDKYEHVVVYGEWCGGNIKSGVALSQLDKMFVVFEVNADGDKLALHDINFPEGVFKITDAPTWTEIIDFEQVAHSQNRLVALTEVVETECPFGKMLGVSGVGEGIVWQCTDEKWQDIRFKVKGQKHSKSNVKTTKTLSPEELARLDDLSKLVHEIMTAERMQQGVEYLKEMKLPIEKKSLPVYLKYVVSDCLEEEKLLIAERGFEKKDLGKQLSTIARDYLIEVESGQFSS